MREILFRGKNYENNQWVYGQYCKFLNGARIDHSIVNIDECDGLGYTGTIYHIADIKTLGQYTGLIDKNRVKIFEGDIIKLSNSTVVVSWENGGLGYISKGWGDFISFAGNNHLKSILSYIEVIGNIHDNPELAEKK